MLHVVHLALPGSLEQRLVRCLVVSRQGTVQLVLCEAVGVKDGASVSFRHLGNDLVVSRAQRRALGGRQREGRTKDRMSRRDYRKGELRTIC